MIEQAVFTSLQGDHRDGYQVVSTSPGIDAPLARELATWGPSHDSLLDEDNSLGSINFHSLAQDRFCVSVTTAVGSEYSGRGGCQVYTQCFVLSRDLLRRFANHPFRLLEALKAAGHVEVLTRIPSQLNSVRLPGRASPVHEEIVADIVDELDVERVVRFLWAVIDRNAVAVTAAIEMQTLFGATLDLLPPSARLEYSFSTALKYSPPTALPLCPRHPGSSLPAAVGAPLRNYACRPE